ncbi:MAG: c-type cytochrome [Vulcanimicrobiaceae bacterium]
MRVALQNASLALALALGGGGCTTRSQPASANFGLGRPASAADVAAWDISVTPDGQGLPPGGGSVAQGATLYQTRCAECHDTPVAPQLWGGRGTLTKVFPQKTVGSYWPYATTLFDYIRRAMPPKAPQSLSAPQIYALCAYILAQSGIVPNAAVLDRTTLPQIRMPNRSGFFASDGKPDT